MTARVWAGSNDKMTNPRGGLPRHEPFPMRVGLDVDDVLLNLTDRWLEEYNEQYDDNVFRADITDWEFSRFVKPGVDIYGLLRPSMYNWIEPLAGAAEFVQAIRDRGHTPVYVTACGGAEEIGPVATKAFAFAKRQALIRHGIAKEDETLIPSKDKRDAPVDILIDDRILNVETFRNGLGVLFTQPWNRTSYLPRARSYSDALTFIDRYARHIPLCEDFSSP